jgi:MoxR-like ATPase
MSINVDRAVSDAVALLSQMSDDHPVHRRSELLTLGVTDATQSAMVRRGALVRLRHGVYVLPDTTALADPVARHRLDLAAAAAAAREPVWAFGCSAALMLGMPLPFRAPEQLVLARASGGDERALRRDSRHRLVIPDCRIVTGPVVVESTLLVRGVPVVDPALAGVGAAADLTSARWRTALLDAAL